MISIDRSELFPINPGELHTVTQNAKLRSCLEDPHYNTHLRSPKYINPNSSHGLLKFLTARHGSQFLFSEVNALQGDHGGKFHQLKDWVIWHWLPSFEMENAWTVFKTVVREEDMDWQLAIVGLKQTTLKQTLSLSQEINGARVVCFSTNL